MTEQRENKKQNNESWFVLCDVTELHLWREQFGCPVRDQPNTPATWLKRDHRCLGFGPLRNDLLQSSGRECGREGGAD